MSCDVFGPGSYVRVGAVGVEGLGAQFARPITSNVTDAQITFTNGKTFVPWVGKSLSMEIIAVRAMVYTVGFISD